MSAPQKFENRTNAVWTEDDIRRLLRAAETGRVAVVCGTCRRRKRGSETVLLGRNGHGGWWTTHTCEPTVGASWVPQVPRHKKHAESRSPRDPDGLGLTPEDEAAEEFGPDIWRVHKATGRSVGQLRWDQPWRAWHLAGIPVVASEWRPPCILVSDLELFESSNVEPFSEAA